MTEREPRTCDIETISPEQITIEGVRCIERAFHGDRRGALQETYCEGVDVQSPYSYISATTEGEARDKHDFHQHKWQEDQFTVPIGVMWLLLLDMREGSSTYGELNIVKLKGMDLNGLGESDRGDTPNVTVSVPIGVLHAIMAPGPGPAAVIVNHPTQKYDPNRKDEGRVPFSSVDIPGIGIFDWSRVKG